MKVKPSAVPGKIVVGVVTSVQKYKQPVGARTGGLPAKSLRAYLLVASYLLYLRAAFRMHGRLLPSTCFPRMA